MNSFKGISSSRSRVIWFDGRSRIPEVRLLLGPCSANWVSLGTTTIYSVFLPSVPERAALSARCCSVIVTLALSVLLPSSGRGAQVVSSEVRNTKRKHVPWLSRKAGLHKIISWWRVFGEMQQSLFDEPTLDSLKLAMIIKYLESYRLKEQRLKLI